MKHPITNVTVPANAASWIAVHQPISVGSWANPNCSVERYTIAIPHELLPADWQDFGVLPARENLRKIDTHNKPLIITDDIRWDMRWSEKLDEATRWGITPDQVLKMHELVVAFRPVEFNPQHYGDRRELRLMGVKVIGAAAPNHLLSEAIAEKEGWFK